MTTRSSPVVGIGPTGAKWQAARVNISRYELRRWRDGVIPDIDEAVASPLRLSDDLAQARRLLELAPEVPFLVWGRDGRRLDQTPTRGRCARLARWAYVPSNHRSTSRRPISAIAQFASVAIDHHPGTSASSEVSRSSSTRADWTFMKPSICRPKANLR
jgi:hypothetical protein